MLERNQVGHLSERKETERGQGLLFPAPREVLGASAGRRAAKGKPEDCRVEEDSRSQQPRITTVHTNALHVRSKHKETARIRTKGPKLGF